MKAALEGFNPGQGNSPVEKELFEHFLRSSFEQVDLLRKQQLHPKLKKGLDLFEKSMVKYQ